MRLRRIACCGVALASLVITAGLSTSGSAAAAASLDRERGAPGTWTKISTGGSGTTLESSLYRTSDGVLHVVYPKGDGTAGQLGHTAISPSGAVIGQHDVLSSPWSGVDSAPALVGAPGGGLRAVFGGLQSTDPGFWSSGRMYTATAPASGASWTLPAEAVGQSAMAYSSYGTAATTLADGTPVAAWPLNDTITWHVGTSDGVSDQSFTLESCCAYDLAMVRDGENVWLGWYANGGSASNNGVFVRQIHPTLGPVIKAPGSSVGADSLKLNKVALVARNGGGVYAAYCVGYPDCDHLGLWKVGSSSVAKVPSSRYAAVVGLSAGPSGRLWVSWADNVSRVRAARTGRSGSGFTPVGTVGTPPGTASVYDLAIDGTIGRGDIVIQVGNGFWHTQVISGLSLRAKPGVWKHGKKRKVTFTVTDAGDAVGGAKVKSGARKCTTKAGGTCAIVFPKSTKAGRLSARASHSGYGGALIKLRVK